nr:MAG TPA: hypothetical protein [Caudoviricetes sp.]
MLISAPKSIISPKDYHQFPSIATQPKAPKGVNWVNVGQPTCPTELYSKYM